ncbi:MAG: hypothetical protein HY547_09475 [Elusimicrobia bacterium]|nr:hypothetical protein [Elusimicrobiota bacterium]
MAKSILISSEGVWTLVIGPVLIRPPGGRRVSAAIYPNLIGAARTGGLGLIE